MSLDVLLKKSGNGDDGSIFYPGQDLCLALANETEEQVCFKGVEVNFDGKATFRNGTELLPERDALFWVFGLDEQKIRVYPPEKSEEEKEVKDVAQPMLLSPSESYEFVIKLPQEFPAAPTEDDQEFPNASKGTICGIDYNNVQVVMELATVDEAAAGQYRTESKRVDFKLIIPPDVSKLSQPVTKSLKKELRFANWDQGFIKATLELSKSAFVPGDEVQFKMEVDNQSKVALKSVDLELRQRMTYYFTEKSKLRKGNLKIQHMNLKNNLPPPGKAKTWDEYALTVPPVLPSHFRHDNIRDVQYEIRLTVSPKLYKDHVVSIPVKIGVPPIEAITSKEGEEEQQMDPQQIFTLTPPSLSPQAKPSKAADPSFLPTTSRFTGAKTFKFSLGGGGDDDDDDCVIM